VQRYNFFPNKQALFLIILNKSFCLLIINQLYSNLISSFLLMLAHENKKYFYFPLRYCTFALRTDHSR